jgi:hypothetical protein
MWKENVLPIIQQQGTSGNPESMHARTRLEEEKLLFGYGEKLV